MSKRNTYKTLEDAYRGATDFYDGAFGQWIDGLWGWTPSLSMAEQKKIFFLLVERLLREGKVILSPPEEFWNKELGVYNTPMRPVENFIGIWDIPIEDQIAYIRDHFPEETIDFFDEEVSLFFYDKYCPRIGWVNPETGKIVAS